MLWDYIIIYKSELLSFFGIFISKFISLLLRIALMFKVSLSSESFTWSINSSTLVTFSPLNDEIISSFFRPALSAGEPFSTLIIFTPLLFSVSSIFNPSLGLLLLFLNLKKLLSIFDEGGILKLKLSLPGPGLIFL